MNNKLYYIYIIIIAWIICLSIIILKYWQKNKKAKLVKENKRLKKEIERLEKPMSKEEWIKKITEEVKEGKAFLIKNIAIKHPQKTVKK